MSDFTNLSQALSANYMTTSLTVRVWSGSRVDRKSTDDFLAGKGAVGNAAKVVKKLLAGEDAKLKDCQAAYTRIRAWFYGATLPWSSAQGSKGTQLVSTAASLGFLGEFANLKAEAEAALTEFLNDYDNAVTRTAASLGALYNPADYPSKDEIRSLFGAHLEIRPVPDIGDFDRINIPADLAGGLKELYERQATAMVDNAMADFNARMADELLRMDTQLSKAASGAKTRLYKSLVTNIEHLVKLGLHMNIAGDTDLNDKLHAVKRDCCAHEISEYKDNAALARAVADNAALHYQFFAGVEADNIEDDEGVVVNDDAPDVQVSDSQQSERDMIREVASMDVDDEPTIDIGEGTPPDPTGEEKKTKTIVTEEPIDTDDFFFS